MQSWNAAFFLFFVGYSLGGGGGGGISGRVRALNLTVPLGSGRVGSDNLGYGPGSGFSFEPVQTSTLQGLEIEVVSKYKYLGFLFVDSLFYLGLIFNTLWEN